MKKSKPFTKKEMEEIEKSLTEKTEEPFRKFAKARRESWHRADKIVLD